MAELTLIQLRDHSVDDHQYGKERHRKKCRSLFLLPKETYRLSGMP